MAKGEGAGNKNNDDHETAILPEGFGQTFDSRAVRASFIRKVYSILLSQLALTTAFIAVFVFTPSIKEFYCDQTYYKVQKGHELNFRRIIYEADPLFARVVSVRPYVRLHFSKSRKTRPFSSENSDHQWRDCGSGRGEY